MTRGERISSCIRAIDEAFDALILGDGHPLCVSGPVDGSRLTSSVVARSAEGAKVGWVEGSGWCLLERDDVVDPGTADHPDEGMAYDAAVSIAGDDALANPPPYGGIVEPRHKGWC
jgi:hypothetical protein